MVRAAIALGSNLGDRSGHLEAAVEALAHHGSVVGVSPVYETVPVGGPDQGAYLNAVVLLETELTPGDLLGALLDIERVRGRARTEKWGPRTLDLDLLLYGAETIEKPGLTVPHPRMTQRRFVLDPLFDVWPEATLPDGTRLESFRAAVGDQEVARFFADDPESEFRPWTALAVFVLFNVAAAIIWRVISWF